jgi:hypothetical protein
VSQFDFRNKSCSRFDFVPVSHNQSQNVKKATHRSIHLCMKMQCRLCLADIPHDYDHSLEVCVEKPEALAMFNHQLDNFDDSCHKLITWPQTLSGWPNSAAIACMLFTLVVANAAILILILVVWSLAASALFSVARN